MCEHVNIVRLADGWYCPDCKQMFDAKPVKVEPVQIETEQAEAPKPKKKTKKGTKANAETDS